MSYDEKRATVTTAKSNAPALIQQLRAADIIAAEIGLTGRFHWSSHEKVTQKCIRLCAKHSELQLPSASELVFPVRGTEDGEFLVNTNLHEVVLHSMLVDRPEWYTTLLKTWSTSLVNSNSQVTIFGQRNCVPPSLMSRIGPHILPSPSLSRRNVSRVISNGYQNDQENQIAVVGMSCNVPGASSLEEFWQILCQGQSQHIPVPPKRFGMQSTFRDADENRKWYGNFLEDYDAFDHKFFKKSPREMSSADPQHRIMLQIVYQALENAGYFAPRSQAKDKKDDHVGCYVGLGLVDYENNIACHPANAYSVTGNLASFAAGKVSHYFGWTGPSMVLNTACSSSAVAIHTACRAILSGECTAAVAAGVNTMSSPEWFHNLAGASFLSPTGQCKPFDSKADGYCRGEGAAAVFLKRYSDAVRDGDQIHGILAATAVYQNRNCTPITVPDSSSLMEMFSHVTQMAGLKPSQISVVEAHGTGTPVGDPAEYEAIRRVFGGSSRSDTLSLGSVKGLVGHTESASGIVSLIKALLMISRGIVPPQASFENMNPAIKYTAQDRIQIDKKCRDWDVEFRAVLINNYGASGTNASMVISQSPMQREQKSASIQGVGSKQPFWISAFDDRALREYCIKLLRTVHQQSIGRDKAQYLADLSVQISRQANHTLPRSLIFHSTSLNDLETTLANFANQKEGIKSIPSTPQRPVIMCLGGQVSTFIGLDRQTFEQTSILRKHLDECDKICQKLGVSGGIFPEIFQREPISDIVKLQSVLFAMQYSCAKSWIDCGVRLTAVVGHSFGELTALCVSGILSIEDALRMIKGRAELIQRSWGEEKGSMMAVEADKQVVEDLLAMANAGREDIAVIACYNGPRSFTLGGSTNAIDVVEKLRLNEPRFQSGTKAKRLQVTNAFHSTLVEPLLPALKEIGKSLHFKDAHIPFERATESRQMGRLTADYVADHMRQPVFFNDAIQRLSQQYPSAVWLEAGSNSTITVMASRALQSNKESHFQPVSITGSGGLDSLADATMTLWKNGVNIIFWPHHQLESPRYSSLLLPPYQFDKSRHWLDLKAAPKQEARTSTVQECNDLWTLLGYQDLNKRHVRFLVDTDSSAFKDYMTGHKVAQTAPICPSILQIAIAVDVVLSLCPESDELGLHPVLENMDSSAPMPLNESRKAWVDVEMLDDDHRIWKWQMSSQGDEAGSKSMVHIGGRISLKLSDEESFRNEFSRFERLVGVNRPRQLLSPNTSVDSMFSGNEIYASFADTVDYSDAYKGVQVLVGKDQESAGRVFLAQDSHRWVSVGLADSFCQVAGVFVNCMTGRPEKDAFISDRIEKWMRSPSSRLQSASSQKVLWEVYACHSRLSEKQYMSDVFIFDSDTGELAEIILGIRYQKVSKLALGKVISGLSSTQASSFATSAPESGHTSSAPVSQPSQESTKPQQGRVSGTVKEILVNLSGLEPDEINDDSDLIELGIDSLMGMELAREIELAFKIHLDNDDLLQVTTLRELVQLVLRALGLEEEEVATEGTNGSVGLLNHQPSTTSHPETNGVSSYHNPPSNGVSNGITNGSHTVDAQKSEISSDTIVECFSHVRGQTDDFITRNGLSGYVNTILPLADELCIIHILNAFEKLGCSIRDIPVGDTLRPVEHLPRHSSFVKCLFEYLEKADLVKTKDSNITRTSKPVPTRAADEILKELLNGPVAFHSDHKLTDYAGANMSDCLAGKADGLQLMFGSGEGRQLLSEFYGQSPINTAWIGQIKMFLENVVPRLSSSGQTINVLEIGAGTGGTTAQMVALFAALGVPVEYTVTDISSSLVAGSRKKFKEYPFMKFRALDIEQEPPAELLQSQHIVISTNCIHATHDLVQSTKHIHQMLHPRGFLMMLEMTQSMAWIDVIFGLLEGWWLFDDGRRHALSDITRWESALHSAGYGHVMCTEGTQPETKIQRIIVALAERYHDSSSFETPRSADVVAREAVVNRYVQSYTEDFEAPNHPKTLSQIESRGSCVVITGATGSLGSQFVAALSQNPQVNKVVCLNRPSSVDATIRQNQALTSRGIRLDKTALAKLSVLETDLSKPLLGLSTADYGTLVNDATHIVHNAWPMSVTRPIKAFEAQFKGMRTLIHLARDIAAHRSSTGKVSFQFISSIATVGFNPLLTGRSLVPEHPMTVDSVLASGYGQAKLVCEHMLEETLNRHPELFHAMTVRIGQIAGSTTSGYWNPTEHLSFMLKSAKTIQALPDLTGVNQYYTKSAWTKKVC